MLVLVFASLSLSLFFSAFPIQSGLSISLITAISLYMDFHSSAVISLIRPIISSSARLTFACFLTSHEVFLLTFPFSVTVQTLIFFFLRERILICHIGETIPILYVHGAVDFRLQLTQHLITSLLFFSPDARCRFVWKTGWRVGTVAIQLLAMTAARASVMARRLLVTGPMGLSTTMMYRKDTLTRLHPILHSAHLSY